MVELKIRDTPKGKLYTSGENGCCICTTKTGKGVRIVDGKGNISIMAVCKNPEHADGLGLGSGTLVNF